MGQDGPLEGEVVPFWTLSFIAMVISTAAVGVAAHNADRIASGSLARALIVNGANLLTYACIWTARYFILNRYLFGARTQVHAQEQSGDAVPEIPVPVTGDAGVLEPGLSTLVAGETTDPVADVL
jgi:hypothetical protein